MLDPETLLDLAPGFIVGLTIHEFSHAAVANRLGDSTARELGRLTLNPLKHLDLFGTLMLLFAGFGWAKPVPVDVRRLHHPRRDMMWIALAGPISNILLALILGGILVSFFSATPHSTPGWIIYGIWINVILAVFNMIPIPPLDGSRVLARFLPSSLYPQYLQFERYGPPVLFGLMLLSSLAGWNIFAKLLQPVARPIFDFCVGIWQWA